MTPLKKLKPPEAHDRLETLMRRVLSMHAERTLEGVLQTVTDAARELTGARYAALGVLSPDGQSLASFVTSGLDPAAKQSIGALPKGLGVLGVLIRDPRPLRLSNIAAHPAAHGFPRQHPPMKSFLGVPVIG